MLTKFKKPTCLFVAVCFSATTFALPALADPGRSNGKTQQQNNSRQEQKKKPEQNNKNQPGRNEQKRPEQNNKNQPDRNEQKRPEQNHQNQPGRNEQKRPEQNNKNQPDRNEQKRPEQNHQNQPGRNEQKKPEQNNKNQPGRNDNRQQKQHFPRDNRRDNVVIKVVRVNHRDFERARHDRLTLRDFIIAMYIARQLGYNDYMPIYVMKKNGRPYKDICKAHGIKWNSVKRHVNSQHKTMNDNAANLGLAIWSLDDVIN